MGGWEGKRDRRGGYAESHQAWARTAHLYCCAESFVCLVGVCSGARRRGSPFVPIRGGGGRVEVRCACCARYAHRPPHQQSSRASGGSASWHVQQGRLCLLCALCLFL
eukprot:scaffold21440_cov146-Isochrysis_galbana.AAC.4